jgi:NADH-quinone oxidoreductase subunit J
VSDAVTTVSFIALAIVTLAGAFGMLAARNVIHAAYSLLVVAVASAGLFALLEARYVALIQLLIYAGAVAILNIFTIMITLRRREDAVRSRDFSLPGVALGVTFFAVVAIAVMGADLAAVPAPDVFPGIVEFGDRLFALDGWVLPFEIASLVLTAALVAAVWWTREGDER